MDALCTPSQSSLHDRGARLLSRIEYSLVQSESDWSAVHRLRYEAYLREGAIAPSPSGVLTDEFDGREDVWTAALRLDKCIVSTIRIHVLRQGSEDSPTFRAFSDLLQPCSLPVKFSSIRRALRSTRKWRGDSQNSHTSRCAYRFWRQAILAPKQQLRRCVLNICRSIVACCVMCRSRLPAPTRNCQNPWALCWWIIPGMHRRSSGSIRFSCPYPMKG